MEPTNTKLMVVQRDRDLECSNRSYERKDDILDCLKFHVPFIGNSDYACRLIIAAFALICYVNSFHGEFVFDDTEAIISNKDLNPETSLADVFNDDFWGTKLSSTQSHKSYRPLTVITFRWNVWFAGGLHPFGFHVVNVVLHVAASLLYLEVCNKLLSACQNRTTSCAFLAAFLFTVHPVHVENVASVVGRAELLSAICYFIVILLYIKCCDEENCFMPMVLWLLSVAALSSCAMLFKEQGISVLGICIAYEIFLHLKLTPSKIQLLYYKRKSIFRCGVILTTLVLVLIWRTQLMGSGPPKFQPSDNPASFSNSTLIRVLTYNYIYALNAWLLLNPLWLCFDWSMGCIPLVESFADPRTLAPMAFWALAVLLCTCSLSKPDGHFKRMVSFSIVLLVIPFLPASNLFFRVGFVVAERVLYLPSAGYCLLFALGLCAIVQHYKQLKTAFRISAVLLLALFTIRSVQRSADWLTEETLYSSGMLVCPLNAKIHYNVGKLKADNGKLAEAEECYKEAIRLFPEYDQALNNYGNLLKETGQLHLAEEMLLRAVKATPEFAAAWMNLGIIQASLNKSREAELSYQTAVLHRRKYPDAYYNLGNLYVSLKLHSNAIRAFEKAIELKTDHYNAWHNLALVYEEKGDSHSAVQTWKDAIATMPGCHLCYFTLGVLLGKLQRYKEGEEYLTKAISMKPDVANYHANLGVIYHFLKDSKRAEDCYRYALRLDPALEVARDNLHRLLGRRFKL